MCYVTSSCLTSLPCVHNLFSKISKKKLDFFQKLKQEKQPASFKDAHLRSIFDMAPTKSEQKHGVKYNEATLKMSTSSSCMSRDRGPVTCIVYNLYMYSTKLRATHKILSTKTVWYLVHEFTSTKTIQSGILYIHSMYIIPLQNAHA